MSQPATISLPPSVEPDAAEQATQARPPRDRVRSLVARRAHLLAESRDRSATVAMFARLRANVGREPGVDPDIWAVTIDGVSQDARGDEPTAEEQAVHLALTLFATHQQSRPQSVHLPRAGFGQAVARLDRQVGGDHDGPSPVRRRFDAVVTSATLAELTHHLRGLVGQMRGADVGLDYGLLAQDLWDFQQPGRADDVRRRWARQYYRLDRAAAEAQTTTESTEENS